MASPSAQLSFVNAGGIPAIVAMAASEGDEVRHEVLRALSRLCATAMLRPALFADGALSALLSAIEDTAAIDAPVRLATAALGRLTELPDVQVAIAKANAVPLLVNLSKTHDAEAQRHVARALGNLAGNADCQRQIGASGGVRPLIKSGYSRNAELQQLVVRAIANLALDPTLNLLIEGEGGSELLILLTRSKNAEVLHWARVAQGNLEAASALGPLVRFCSPDSKVEPVDMLTMSALVGHLRSRDQKLTPPVRRLTASAIANLLVSGHNQRLLLECNGIKALVALAHEAAQPELQAQCMRALANIAVSPEYRSNILQAKVLPLLVGALDSAVLSDSGTATYESLCHAARALANMCVGGDVEAAIQQMAANIGAVKVLLDLLARTQEYL
eukprot:4218217-Prymnesium_polylepis.1